MLSIEVFDPAMCCSTGVCGPSVDPKLPQFAADLEWLKKQGIAVNRYNLSQEPGEFVSNAAVKKALDEQGDACLPIIMMDDSIKSQGCYPNRASLACMVGLATAETVENEPAASCCTGKGCC